MRVVQLVGGRVDWGLTGLMQLTGLVQLVLELLLLLIGKVVLRQRGNTRLRITCKEEEEE